jgi:hypothetical protein
VENVFQIVPQVSNAGSGVPPVAQHHILDALGCQPHNGHLIRLEPSRSSRSSAGLDGRCVRA